MSLAQPSFGPASAAPAVRSVPRRRVPRQDEERRGQRTRRERRADFPPLHGLFERPRLVRRPLGHEVVAVDVLERLALRVETARALEDLLEPRDLALDGLEPDVDDPRPFVGQLPVGGGEAGKASRLNGIWSFLAWDRYRR